MAHPGTLALPDEQHATGAAILAALQEMEPIVIDAKRYLFLTDALDTVAAILYPDDIQSAEEAERVEAVTRHACALAGYAEETRLGPPQVPFAARGTYLKQLPELTDAVVERVVQDVAARWTHPLTVPKIALRRQHVLTELASVAWRLSAGQLQSHHLRVLGSRADAVAVRLGWQMVEDLRDDYWPSRQGAAYVRTLTPNLDQLREALRRSLATGYLKTHHLRVMGLRAAFGDTVSQDPDGLIPEETWRAIFAELGFVYDRDAAQLTLIPLDVPEDAFSRVRQVLEGLTIYQSAEYGSLLLEEEVKRVSLAALGISGDGLDERRLAQLVTEGVVAEALTSLGYETHPLWVGGRTLTPAYPEYAYFLPRTIRVPQVVRRVEVAEGFPVRSPTLVCDDETLVYLELTGPRQAVHANWAALRARNRTHWIGGTRLVVAKEDGLITLKRALPCGWDHWCLIHRQASCQEMTPERPFYLIDDGVSPIPAAFLPMLARALAAPVLSGWSEYLWLRGRISLLVRPLTDGCLGLGGWKVIADDEQWEGIIGEGLKHSKLAF